MVALDALATVKALWLELACFNKSNKEGLPALKSVQFHSNKITVVKVKRLLS